MKIISSEKRDTRSAINNAISRRAMRRRSSQSGRGTITLDSGETYVVIDFTKGFSYCSPMEISQFHITAEGNHVFVTESGDCITCREAYPEDTYPVLQPKWLAARLTELKDHDQKMGYDENLVMEGTTSKAPVETLGILQGQTWVRQTPDPELQTQGYPYLIEVRDTEFVWGNLITVSILVPTVLRGKSFPIKPSRLLDAYELYMPAL